jgi:hypothetical protein
MCVYMYVYVYIYICIYKKLAIYIYILLSLLILYLHFSSNANIMTKTVYDGVKGDITHRMTTFGRMTLSIMTPSIAI